MKVTFSAVARQAADVRRNPESVKDPPNPEGLAPDVVLLLADGLGLSKLAASLTDPEDIKHIVDNTPEADVGRLITFGRGAAPDSMKETWANAIKERFAKEMVSVLRQENRLKDSGRFP